MAGREVWGPWIVHDHSGCPVPVGTIVHRVFDAPVDVLEGVDIEPTREFIGPVKPSEMSCWHGRRVIPGSPHVLALVVKYRIRRFAAMSDLERIAANPTPCFDRRVKEKLRLPLDL